MRWLLLGLVFPLLAQDSEIRLVPVASGFNAPTDVQHSGDGSGRLFVVEQSGTVRILRNGAVLARPFLDIQSRVRAGGERGLLGLAFPPGFAGKQRLYINYTDLLGNTVIAMYRVTSDPDVADPTSEQVLLNITQPFANHNGGQLRFGPDGYLYIGMGDGGSAGDPFNYAQAGSSLLGKLLRIDVESEPGQVRIPPDNPFVNVPGTRPEIWAFGLRNPWRFYFDRANADLYIADVGQNTWEEVNYASASSHGGENYGWSAMEGLVCYRSGCTKDGFRLPVAVYRHENGDCSVTGGFVYRGRRSPGLRGTYLYADYCTGRMRTLRHEGGQWVNTTLALSGGLVTTFGEDEEGEVYVANSAGTLARIDGSSAPRIALDGVVNAASFLPGIVAGSLATVFAAGVLDDPGVVSATNLPLPVELAGVSVEVNGMAAPILAVANVKGIEQVNFQAPFGIAGSTSASVVVSRAGLESVPEEIALSRVQPGLFPVVVHNADYTLVTEERPLVPNEFAFIYATGLGPVSNPPDTGAAASSAPLSVSLEEVRVTLAGIPCEVPFAGLAPGFAGVYQVNFRVPSDSPAGLQELIVTAGEASSTPIQVPVL